MISSMYLRFVKLCRGREKHHSQNGENEGLNKTDKELQAEERSRGYIWNQKCNNDQQNFAREDVAAEPERKRNKTNQLPL